MATILAPSLATTSVEVTGVAPIIVDLGKVKKRRIKDLKRGRGRLVDEVSNVLNQVSAGLGDEAGNKQLVPIVLIYKKKNRGRGGNRGGGGGGGRLTLSGGGNGNGGIFPFNFPFLFG
ncbi:MAG TPA: hypothetical protein VF659_14550 [Pyrinomonadaceae bacterium]|jgi:uncharacterized membrane protein YgcG